MRTNTVIMFLIDREIEIFLSVTKIKDACKIVSKKMYL